MEKVHEKGKNLVMIFLRELLPLCSLREGVGSSLIISSLWERLLWNNLENFEMCLELGDTKTDS